MSAEPKAAAGAARFGVYEVDLDACELRKQGVRVRLQDQPYQVLRILLERPGEVVRREDLRQRIWPADTFVDFDHGLNNAVKRLREALGDSADAPRYVETVPRRGYRFIATVEMIRPARAGSAESNVGDPTSPPVLAPSLSSTGLAPAPQALPHQSILRTQRLALVAAALILFLASLIILDVARVRERTLQAVGPIRESPQRIQSIAVLPLTNLSGDPAQEYFADGMTDELITELSNITALKVISRTSAMRYKKTGKSLPEIARELRVDAVVEGTVMRSGERVRINVQLIQGPTEKYLWGASFERGAEDVLALQQEVARSIAEQIQVTLTPREKALLASARPVNPRAHELYLKGHFHLHKWGREEWIRAIDCFQQAIREDPDYASAYVGLADTHKNLADFADSEKEMSAAEAAATKAVALDGTLAEAHRVLGEIKFRFDWDWPGAEKEFERALELNPNSPRAHVAYGEYLRAMNRWDEAVNEYQKAQEADPLSADAYLGLAETFVELRRYDPAIRYYQKAFELEPNHALAHFLLKSVYERKGMYKEALAEWQKALDLYGRKDISSALSRGYARSGYKGVRLEWLKALKAEHMRGESSAHLIADAYHDLGDKNRALEWLQKSVQERDEASAFLNTSPYWDDYRADPRFQAILQQVGFGP